MTKIGQVLVSVTDQDEAIAFYTQVLRFTLTVDAPFGAGSRWVADGAAPLARGAPHAVTNHVRHRLGPAPGNRPDHGAERTMRLHRTWSAP